MQIELSKDELGKIISWYFDAATVLRMTGEEGDLYNRLVAAHNAAEELEGLESERTENARLTDEIERLQAELADARSCAKAWEQEMTRARADERTAMHYLEQIRTAVAPDVDFPTLVQRCGELQAQASLAAHDAEVIERAAQAVWPGSSPIAKCSRLLLSDYANQLRAEAKGVES